MLQSIRNKAQNWVFSIIIFVLVLTFAFFGVERFFEGNSVSSNTMAKVNGHKITQDQFNTAYQRLRRQLELQMGQQFSITPQIEDGLKSQALEQIIHNYILTQAAITQGYRVTTGQIDSVLLSIPMFQDNGQFSAARFQNVLNNLLYTQNSFLSQLQTDMLVNQAQIGIVNSAFVLPNELANAYRLINQQRSFAYAVIPSNKFIGSVNITSADAQQYYNTHQQEFTTPEKVSISYLELNLQNLISKQKFTEAQLKQYYETNLTNFTVPERWHVAQILVRLMPNSDAEQISSANAKMAEIEQQLKSGQSFAAVAAKYSEDVITAQKGGVLPWFSAGMIEPGIVSAVSKLKPGEVSAPVQTKFGLSIYKLLAYTPKKVEPYDKVAVQVKNMMQQEYAQKQFATENEELSNLTFSDSGSLSSAAKALDLPIQTTDLFSKAGTKTGITSNPKIVNAAFSNTTLVEKYNSNPIQINDTSVVVLRVDNHVPAVVKPFDQVSSEIMTLLKSQAMAVKAKQLGSQILASSKTEAEFQKLVAQNGLVFQSFQNVGRHADNVRGSILNEAFQLPKPSAKVSTVFTGLSLSNGDYAVIAVTGVTDGDVAKMTAQQAKVYGEQLASQFGQLDYGLYALQEINQAKVKIYKNSKIK